MTAFVENLFSLSTKLLKRDLAKSRQKEVVEGYLNIIHDNKPSVIDYSVEYYDDKAYLVVIFGIEPQKILLSEHQLTFGVRTYLNCNCGCRTNALYLKNGVFGCRKCQNVHYTSTTLNRSSRHGAFLYKQNQILKLMTQRESMNRIFYRSHYSKRFMRWLGLYGRLGLIDELVDAEKLETAIHR